MFRAEVERMIAGGAQSEWSRAHAAWRSMRVLTPLALLGLSACSHLPPVNDPPAHVAVIGSLAKTSPMLAQLPPAPRQITVAVYDFPDLTGQRKPTPPGAVVSELSTAVTQGASSIMIEALKAAGSGTYFNVVDRTRDADQVRERSVIADSTGSPSNKPDKKADGKAGSSAANANIRRLRPAEYIINGGLVAFERSVLISNSSLAILGIGGSKSVIRNYVSVTMRMVRADTAEVVASVTAYRSVDTDTAGISSHSRASNGLFPDTLLTKYPSPSDYLEADFSGTRNEMTQIAIREAIEAGLIELIDRGNQMALWQRPPQLVVASSEPLHHAYKPRLPLPKPEYPRRPGADQPLPIEPKPEPEAGTQRSNNVSTVNKTNPDGQRTVTPERTVARILWDQAPLRLSSMH
jgi:curli production assembly/transport component CsgG